MSGIILSFFLSIILLIRLLPLNSTTNLLVSVISGVIFFLLGISEVSEKGWKAYLVSLVGILFIIFTFFPKLRVGTNYSLLTIILCVIVIVISIYSEIGFFKLKKKKE